MNLITTGITNNKDTSSSVLLGPWCYPKTDQGSVQYNMVPSPWDLRHDFDDAAKYCNELYEKALSEISVSLNLLHQVAYDKMYWEIIVGPWLMRFIQTFHERYERLIIAKKTYPDFVTGILRKEESSLVVANTSQHDRVDINSHLFNLKMFSVLMRAFFQDNVENEFSLLSEGQKEKNDRGLDRAKKLPNYDRKKSHIRSVLDFLGGHGHADLVVARFSLLNHYNTIDIRRLLGRKTIRFVDHIIDQMNVECSTNHYESDARNKIGITGDVVTGFERVLFEVLSDALPVSMVEKYSEYQKKAAQAVDEVKPLALLSDVGWNNDDAFKYFAANVSHRGGLLVEAQQGGGWRTNKIDLNRQSGKKKDRVFLWTPKNDYMDNVRWLPNPSLCYMHNSCKRAKDDILFIGTASRLYHYKYMYRLMPDDIEKYFSDKVKFISRLKPSIVDNLVYRPYLANTWNETGYLLEHYPQLKIMKRQRSFLPRLHGELIKAMQRAKVVVIDHPHTSYLQALTINVPCIFYWDKNLFRKNDVAEEELDVLRRLSILHSDPSDAAKSLNNIYDNAYDWWQTPEVQSARDSYLNYTVKVTKNWKKVWCDELQLLKADATERNKINHAKVQK
jgi:putative transferase (TIGR04331 family)